MISYNFTPDPTPPPGIADEKLTELVLSLHEEDRLCVPVEQAEAREPRIICSLGIAQDSATP